MHSALFYRGDREYLDAVVPFILDGLRSSEPVLVAVPTGHLSLLRDGLGDACADVTMADMADVGRNPARAMGVMATFADRNRDRRVRIVGEPVWPGRSADEYPGCVENEALCNALFADREAAALCPYDARGLGENALADARSTHPLLWRGGTTESNADYAPDEALARYNQPLPSDTMAVTYTVRELADLSPARSFAARYAQWLGLSPEGIASLQLIATELATNSLQHTGGVCRLAFWQHNGHIVCEAGDAGRLEDPLAGRRPPAADALTGRGLFLVNTVADLVRTHATATGTTIQAYFRLG
ncbi:anti-sigma factor RsbA family regulatory protein [Mycobacterium sp. MFM001]|uniref:anti-sigma factor RsbA family regulatory protein n=1 Tax=Mycobacterium sp. MFM001 TaxID=2049453 RepID=UPI001EDF336F|nr:anti-sigma factor RsbA family regulatory protein [Mycobacterium sp. MFM001]